MEISGYGKILRVDLTHGDISQAPVNPEFAARYIGGMGFGCKILYDELQPDVDPLGPDNILVYAIGPLTGTNAPTGARTEITNKSPLTSNIGTGNTGGLWGTNLKRAGFDVIVVKGRASRPVYLWIDDGEVALRDAAHLWGKDTRQTSDALVQELGSGISVLCIGPAGENMVRFACPINDYHHVAARGGAGAVMGSKNLKAIAVHGSASIHYAEREKFEAAAREARERIIDSDNAFTMPGAPPEPRRLFYEMGCLPGRNFQTGTLPGWLESRTLVQAKPYQTKFESVCHACPVPCFRLAEVKDGRYAGVRANRGHHPGVVLDWGAKCGIDNMPAIWKCKEMCQLLGLDYCSAAGVIAFAMELYSRGIISDADTDGLPFNFGNENSAIQTLGKIGLRQGFGNLLAEGSVRAAAIIGKGATKYVMTTKGLEESGLDPRSGPRGWIFGDLTNPRGGDNVKSTHMYGDRYNPNWPIDKYDMPEEMKTRLYGNVDLSQLHSSWEGKPLMCRWFEDLYSAANALGLCFFPVGFKLSLGPTLMARLYSAYTGLSVTPPDMVKLGERVFTLLKLNQVRFGFSRKDDIWPDRFFDEPLPEGPAKGRVLSRREIQSLLDEYYRIRDWDIKTGCPTAQKLKELGLP